MSRVQPFQFEPSCPPCKEPIDQEESESGDTNQQDARGRIEWCSCKKCEAMATEEDCFCCQELAELNQKFDESGLFRGIGCITEHAKFRIVCLDTEVLNTALVAIHNIRCNSLLDLIENRTWRLAAYRQFTWWAHGALGKKIGE
ncbi:unnamed protein product [Porites lobata]|uniref:Uncharacterized protein n=1 Tax=Porites lobata TaxID=104759 RepID=A0ABN8RGQ4_9CNID|nr:unnamed protein product [Porites lobata]